MGQSALFVPMPAALAALTAAPCTDLKTVRILCCLREGCPNPFSHLDGFFPGGLQEHRGEFVAAGSTYQIRPTHRFSCGFSKHPQNTVADRMTKTVIDRFKMIEIDQEHGSWPRIADMTLGRQHDVLQERSAIGDAGDRIDHGWPFGDATRCAPSPWPAG